MLYTAVISMFIMALFSLIHDVARVSEDKMQMQNAADAAALEFATWQARGMNTVQNLNQEIYNLDNFVISMYYAAAVLTWVGQPLKGGAGIGVLVEGVGAGLYYAGLYIHHFIGVGMLQSLRHFYAFGTNIMAYISANEVASLNGAAPILEDIIHQSTVSTNNILGKMVLSLTNTGMNSINVICIPTSFNTMFTLPLTGEKGYNHPLNISFSAADIGKDLIETLAQSFADQLPVTQDAESYDDDPEPDIPETDEANHLLKSLANNAADIVLDALTNMILEMIMRPTIKMNTFTMPLDWNFFTWQDSYYRSDDAYNEAGKTSLPPVLAVVYKKQNPGLISRYLLQANSPIPVMAYAVARCEGGNVDAYFPTTPSGYRRNTYGVSASAVLVPFSKITDVFAERPPKDRQEDILEILKFLNGFLLH